MSLLLLIGVTWKLWTPQQVFPQVPLILAVCEWPGWLDWMCLAILVTAAVTILFLAHRSMVRRVAMVGIALSLGLFFVLDQHRLQPWAWQFFVLSLLLALADDQTARRGWMWLVISIYFWSATLKFDYTFIHEQGPVLLGGLKQAMGMRGIPNRWTELLDVIGAVGLAVGELGVALLLLCPLTRRWGLWAATLMHVGLLAALGPFGLNHSNGVLIWNMFFIAQDWLLFRTFSPAKQNSTPPPNAHPISGMAWRNRVAIAGMVFVCLWPILEPFGYCDHWLAWGLYSQPVNQCHVLTDGDATLPSHMVTERYWVEATSTDHPIQLQRVRLADWSLQELAVPIYPQNRFHVGVMIALIPQVKFRGGIVFDRRIRWTGHSIVVQSIGVRPEDNLESLADSYFWNARPRRLSIKPRDPTE